MFLVQIIIEQRNKTLGQNGRHSKKGGRAVDTPRSRSLMNQQCNVRLSVVSNCFPFKVVSLSVFVSGRERERERMRFMLEQLGNQLPGVGKVGVSSETRETK